MRRRRHINIGSSGSPLAERVVARLGGMGVERAHSDVFLSERRSKPPTSTREQVKRSRPATVEEVMQSMPTEQEKLKMENEAKQPVSSAIKVCRDAITAGIHNILGFRQPPFHLVAIEADGRVHTHELREEFFRIDEYAKFLERVANERTCWPVTVVLAGRAFSAASRINALESHDGTMREIS